MNKNDGKIEVIALLLVLNLSASLWIKSDINRNFEVLFHNIDFNNERYYQYVLEDQETENNQFIGEIGNLTEEGKYGLFYVDVVTISNKEGKKISYLVVESDFKAEEAGYNLPDLKREKYEKFFEGTPSPFVVRTEKTTYSRVSKDSLIPFAFKTEIFAQSNEEKYMGSYVSFDSVFGNSQSRNVWNVVNQELIKMSEFCYEVVDSEFDVRVENLTDVLGVQDTSLKFTLSELVEIEKEINDRNELTLG